MYVMQTKNLNCEHNIRSSQEVPGIKICFNAGNHI